MNTRLKQFLAAENITQAQFADTIKVVRASVSHVLSGRNNPGYDFIKAIMTAYPLLNVEWLMLGKGKMYKDGKSSMETGLLFSDPDNVETAEPPVYVPLEDKYSLPLEETKEFIEKTTTIDTSREVVQNIVRQRKIAKIIVLFDDGSFEEMGH